MKIDHPPSSKTLSPLLKIFSLIVISILIHIIPDKAEAHPHVFVDCTLTFEFDSEGLKGIRQNWRFDEMFATMILGDFNIDHNDELSPAEAKELENGAFVNLRNFNYFTTILVDGQKYTIPDATEFKPIIENSTLVYSFFIPCRVKEDGSKHTVIAAIYDDSLYTAIQLDTKNKISDLPSTIFAKLDVDISDELASIFTQMTPEAAILTFSAK